MSQVKAIPEGMHTLTPHLVCAGAAEAIEFYKRAFGATEVMRVPGPEGKLMHAQIRIGDSALMLVDEFPDWGCLGPNALKLTSAPVTLNLYVEDADSFVARAVAAGAEVTMPLENMFWGDRYGQVKDPFGHHWAVATHVRDMTPAEIAEAMKQAPGNCG